MIFGIKTKKDKQIEQLQKALEEEKLKNEIPNFIRVPVKTIMLGASYDMFEEQTRLLPREKRPEYIKSVLATQLIHELKDRLDVSEEYVPYMNVTRFKTRIEVIVR